MEKWTFNRLQQLVSDGIEESSQLEYKRAAALAKTGDKEKAEIVKQVTAMANAAGGTIIYGIAEFSDKEKRHLPEKLDPVDRAEISREWLDSIIQSIQPRIDGVLVYPVTDDVDANKGYYVVEVPASHTAHQARDLRYCRRRNFQVLPMEDYEVRDVMNRKTHPKIKASIFINRSTEVHGQEGVLLIKLENVGSVSARHTMVDIELPIKIITYLNFEGDVTLNHTGEEEYYYQLRITPPLVQPPLFPGSSVTLRRKFTKTREIKSLKGEVLYTTDQIKLTIYADEMPPIKCKLPALSVINDWIEVIPE